MKNSLIIHIEKGQVANRQAVKALFSSLLDGKYLVEIHGTTERTSLQNRYYWGCVVPAIQSGMRHLGNQFDKEEVHEFLKARFNYAEVVNAGHVAHVPRSTANLSTSQFIEFIGRVQQFAAEFLGIDIPDPELTKSKV